MVVWCIGSNCVRMMPQVLDASLAGGLDVRYAYMRCDIAPLDLDSPDGKEIREMMEKRGKLKVGWWATWAAG